MCVQFTCCVHGIHSSIAFLFLVDFDVEFVQLSIVFGCFSKHSAVNLFWFYCSMAVPKESKTLSTARNDMLAKKFLFKYFIDCEGIS